MSKSTATDQQHDVEAAKGAEGIDDAEALFVDDDSWAQPRVKVGRGWKVLSVGLALAALTLTSFGLGTRLAPKPASPFPNLGRGGFGGAGFPGGGFGGLGGGAGMGGGAGLGGAGLGGGTGTGQGNSATEATTAPGSNVLRGVVSGMAGSTLTITKADGSTAVVFVDEKTRIVRKQLLTSPDRAGAIAPGAEVEIVGDSPQNTSEISVGDLAPLPSATGSSMESTTTVDTGLGGLLPT